MRTKTTLGLMLICGAVLAACGQKEPAAPAASTAAAPAPVQTSTPPPQRRWPQQRNRRMRWVSARSPTSARCATPQGLPGHQSRATRPTGGHASHKVRTPFTSTHWRASTATRGPCPHAVDRPCRTTPSRLRLTTWWRSRSSAMHPLPPSNLGRRRCLAGCPCWQSACSYGRPWQTPLWSAHPLNCWALKSTSLRKTRDRAPPVRPCALPLWRWRGSNA